MKTYIVGAGDFAREVADTCHNIGLEITAFIDGNTKNNEIVYRGIKNISDESLFIETELSANIIIGVGNPNIRMKIAKNYCKFNFPTIIHHKAIVMGIENTIGKGVIIQPGVIITNRITISDFAVVNLNTTIGHDSFIGEYSNISPGSNINGHTRIGGLTNIGSNVSSVPTATIGNNCVVGAGTVLRGNYPDNTLIVGVPGRVVKYL